MRPQSIANRQNPTGMSDAMYDLGFDVTPFINAATQIGKSAAEIEAIRKAGKANTAAAPVVYQQPASRGIPPIVWGLGLAVLGVGGILLWRSRSGGNRRRR